MDTPLAWVLFNAIVLLLLALDLGVFHRRARIESLSESAIWSAIWVAASLGFGFWIWHRYGRSPGLEFFTGYLIEKSLSLDNLFIFAVLFRYFAVDPRHQHRVLYWGVLGVLVMRGALIGAGAALIRQFHWVLYLFGVFLIYAGFQFMWRKTGKANPENNIVLRWARRNLPFTKDYEEQHFFVRRGSKWLVTPLLLVLLVIEATDFTLALDSIPAVFAVTRDPFIVYTSNVCAILGLRSFYFLLAGVLPSLRHLDRGLPIVLLFIGGKMLVEPWWRVPTHIALLVVGGVLAISILASLISRGGIAPESERASGIDIVETASRILQLADREAAIRSTAAQELYRSGRSLGDAAIARWRSNSDLAGVLHEEPTVGIAVPPDRFEAIHTAAGRPRLATVPPDQDAIEFELLDGSARLDILTSCDPNARGAIARYLRKFGEGIQQIEYPVADVDRAIALVLAHFGDRPVYPKTRSGADGTRVNFFLLTTPAGQKVLVELVEPE